MKNRYIVVMISFFLWLMPLHIQSKAVQEGMFDCELNYLQNKSYDRCVYLGEKCSNLKKIIIQISNLDNNKNSILCEFRRYTEKGFLFAEWDAVASVLDYAEQI